MKIYSPCKRLGLNVYMTGCFMHSSQYPELRSTAHRARYGSLSRHRTDSLSVHGLSPSPSLARSSAHPHTFFQSATSSTVALTQFSQTLGWRSTRQRKKSHVGIQPPPIIAFAIFFPTARCVFLAAIERNFRSHFCKKLKSQKRARTLASLDSRKRENCANSDGRLRCAARAQLTDVATEWRRPCIWISNVWSC